MWNLVFCRMPSGFHDVQQMIGITKKERREKIHVIILQSFSYLMHAIPQTSFPYSESRESLTHSRHLMSKASLEYVGDIAGSAKNTRTTISGMTAQYWKSVVVGFENRLVTLGLTLPQRKAARGIALSDENFLTEQLYR